MERLAILSDSHIPDRADAIPVPFRERIRDADHAVHAGDLTAEGVIEDVRSLAGGDLTAVSGNMDGWDLGLPPVDTLGVGGVTVVVTHGTGSPHGYEERVAGAVREATGGSDAVGVAGHTHEVLDTTHEGVRILNPGSVTGAAPASRATMMTATVDDSGLSVTVHEAP